MASDRDPSLPDAPWWPVAAFRRRVSGGWALLVLGLLSQSGCMSAITATTLREALRETAASLSTPHDLDHAALGPKSRRSEDGENDAEETDHEADAAEIDDVALEKVIDNAVARLSAAGGIDPATQELLIQTLETTPPQDWAVVVNDFAATLEAARGADARAPRTEEEPGSPRHSADAPAPTTTGGLIMPAAPAPLAVAGIVARPIGAAAPVAAIVPAVASSQIPPAVEPIVIEPAATPAAAPNAAALPAPVPAAPVPDAGVAPLEPIVAGEAPAVAAPAESEAPLPPEPEAFADAVVETPPPVATAEAIPPGPSINNPCFATRVRGWGQIDRFPGNGFRPGQEVIVYFELDRLRIRADAAGHTTSIDSAFRLLDGAGEQVGQWTFEPIEETCPSPRRDYFARYFLRIPADAKPGPHRLEWSVTDAVAGATRQAHLDLDVVPAP